MFCVGIEGGGATEKERAALLDELGVEPQPVEALPREPHQVSHAAGVEDERAHCFVQFSEELWKRAKRRRRSVYLKFSQLFLQLLTFKRSPYYKNIL